MILTVTFCAASVLWGLCGGAATSSSALCCVALCCTGTVLALR